MIDLKQVEDSYLILVTVTNDEEQTFLDDVKRLLENSKTRAQERAYWSVRPRIEAKQMNFDDLTKTKAENDDGFHKMTADEMAQCPFETEDASKASGGWSLTG